MFYVIATPIGNLEDITLRALKTLAEVDCILAEDTRVTRRLLERHGIKKEVISYHQHSTLYKIDQIIAMLKQGKNVALVSDAGTPGINDPGSFLVKKILEALPDTKIIPIPGPNAAISALSISGFPTDRFIYMGFPPHKKGRQTFFKTIAQTEGTVVFYESKHRILKALESLHEVAPERPLMVARELTKQFETIYRGTAAEILPRLKDKDLLGEFVVVIDSK